MDVRQETASLVKSIIDELIHQSVHLLTVNTSAATGETTGRFRAGQLTYDYRIQGDDVAYSPVGATDSGRADSRWSTGNRTVPQQRSAFRRFDRRLARLDGAADAMAITAIDSITAPLTAVLAASLPGAAVLRWEHQPHGLCGQAAAADGLVYRFRLDGETVRFRPAWDVETDAAWAARSKGFLAARGHRLDFRDTGAAAKAKASSKKACTTGYGCGATCISVSKECVIRPNSAIGKERLRRLQELVRQGDPKAAKLRTAVAEGRNQKAKGLQQGRQVERLREMLKDPAVAQMVRSGKLPAASAGAPGAGPAPRPSGLTGTVAVVAPDDVAVDAKRFQFKLNSSASGEVGSLAGIKKWDDNLAGVISVWQDPADGKTYVVNGHNRLALARRMEVSSVTVRYLKAANANEARAIGAMQNIAQGQGSSVDAAKFFRDSGITSKAAVEAAGLPLASGKAEQGLGLARLPDGMFRAVIDGDLSPIRGAIVGNSGLSKAKQGEIGKLLRQRRNISDGTLAEYVENLAISQATQQGALDIFGGQETVDNGLARAELSNNLKRKLAREKSLFATVSKSRAAEALQLKAGNKINQRESAGVAAEADQVLKVFKELKDKAGPVANALNSAASRMMKGEPAAAVKKQLEEEVIAAMQEELERAGLRKKAPTNEAPTASMFDSLIARVIRLDARVRSSPGQLPLLAGGAQPELNLQGGTASQAPGKPPAVGRAAKAAATRNGRAGKPCGESFISAANNCWKGNGAVTAAPAASSGGAPDYSPKASAERAKGGLKFSRYMSGPHPTFSYKFRDRDAAEHWYANDVARAETDIEIGTVNRRSKEWQADYAKGYEQQRKMLAGIDDQNLLETVQDYASVGRSSRGGTATLVKIGAPAADRDQVEPAQVIPTPRRFAAKEGAGGMVYAGESDDGSRFVPAKPNAAKLFTIPRQEASASPAASKTPLAAAMRQAIQQMKAADVRQMSVLANQLFESEWSLERNQKWKGLSKEAAKQSYIQDFGKKLQQAQAEREQQSKQEQPEASGKPLKLSERMRQLTDAMKASDKRMEDLGGKIFELRRRTMGLDSPPDGEPPDARRRALPRGK